MVGSMKRGCAKRHAVTGFAKIEDRRPATLKAVPVKPPAVYPYRPKRSGKAVKLTPSSGVVFNEPRPGAWGYIEGYVPLVGRPLKKGRVKRSDVFEKPSREVVKEIFFQGGHYHADYTPSKPVKPSQPRTLHRKRFLTGVGEVTVRATEVFGSKEAALAWLTNPSVWLGDRTPLDMIQAGQRDEVERYLGRVEYGVYA